MALDDADLKILTGMDDTDLLYQSIKEVKQGMTDEGLDLEHSLPELTGDKEEGHNIPESLPVEVVDGTGMVGPSRSVVDKEDLAPKEAIFVPKGPKPKASKKGPVEVKDLVPKKAIISAPVVPPVESKKVENPIKVEMSPLEGQEVTKINQVPPPTVKIALSDRATPPSTKVLEKASIELNDILDEVITIPIVGIKEILGKEENVGVERPVKVTVYNLVDSSGGDSYTNPNENYLSHYAVDGSWFNYKFDSNLGRFITQMSFGRYIIGPVGLMRKLGVRLAGEMRLLNGYEKNGLIYLTVCAENPGKILDPKEAILIIVQDDSSFHEGV